MNYYQHHIGDFNSATRHLTRVERSLYRDLIELYYDTEQPLPADDFDRLARRVLAVTDEEKAALRFVLEEFFTLDGTVYRQKRCDIEMEKYRNNNSAKARAGKASADARRRKISAGSCDPSTHDEHVLNECLTNQEPITNNQEPIDKKNIQKKHKPDVWKKFFDAYPENKKGGTDAAAWKAAQREGLVDVDFEAMLADVEKRKRLCLSWYSKYALGITRYISERFWLTPVTPDIPKARGGPHEPVTDAEFLSQLDPEIARQLLAQSAGDISGVAVGGSGRSSGMGPGVQAPALKRIR